MQNDKSNVTVGIFKTHDDAENAVKALQKSGLKMNQLSIVGKDYHTDEGVVGYYNAGDRMKYWGKQGAFWGGLWGVLFGTAFFWVPAIGPLLVAGPLVITIVAGLESAAVIGGLSALGAGLVSIGIPKDSIINYETAVKAGYFVIAVHGTALETENAREVIKYSGNGDVETY